MRKLLQKQFLVKVLLAVLILTGINSWGQTIASDGLNGSSSLFTLSGGVYYSTNSASGDRPASVPQYVEGTSAYGVNNGTATLTSVNINTSAYSDIELSFRLASFSVGSTGNGADATDIVTVEVSPNGGTTWYSTIRVTGPTVSNAYWSFTSGTGIATTAYDGNTTPVNFAPAATGDRTTDGYSTVKVTGLPSASNLKVRVTLLNNANGEKWIVDDFKVAGTLIPVNPAVTTNAASGITATSAVLNGAANANGASALTLAFEYGITTGYGTAATSVSPTTASGSSNTSYTGTASVLTPNTTYNFRATGNNGTTYNGSNATFLTLANVPGTPVVNGAAVTTLNVSFDGVTINSNPATTQFAIQETGGQYVQANGSLGAAAVWQTASVWGTKTVTGLTANTNYNFRVKARNSANAETAFGTSAAGTTLVNTLPTLSASTLDAFGAVCINTTPAEKYFTLLGENLTSATVTVGPLPGYTFATSAGGTYGTTVTYNADVNGSILADVYVKFTPTAVQSYNANIPVSGGGASSIDVVASGSGVSTTPTVTTTAVTVFTGTTATMGGNVTVQGCTPVTSRGVVYATTANPSIGGNGVNQLPAAAGGTGAFTVNASSLTGSTLYYVRAYAINDNGVPAYGAQVQFTTQCTVPVNASALTATAGSTQVTLGWTNGSCSDSVIVVAKLGSAVTATPTGDGSNYTANAAFTSGFAIATDEYVVFNGTGTSVTVTGLTNGSTYHFRVFTKRGTSWSSGVITTGLPAIQYCTPPYTYSCATGEDGIDGFVLSGISNLDSGCNGNNNNYINYPASAFTTTLFRGTTYQATVKNGNDQGNIAIWIDFNDNGTFEDSERFSNTSIVNANETIVIPINVPTNAMLGVHRLRVREIYGTTFGVVNSCTSGGYGETEDYTITIEQNNLPTVTTAAITLISTSSSSTGGNVVDQGASAITAKGVVYGVAENPTLENLSVVSGSGTGSFTSNISGLSDNTKYYVRAYATNSYGTAYGNQLSFTTNNIGAPVSTLASGITPSKFTANWNAVAGATGYRLDVSTSSTFGTTAPQVSGLVDFTSLTTTATASSGYGTVTTVDTHGVTWITTEGGARTDQTITGQAICFNNSASQYQIESDVIQNGLTSLSFKYQQKFTGNNGTITVKAMTGPSFNVPVQIGNTVNITSTVQTFSVSNITTVTGPYKIRIETNGSVRVALDDINYVTGPGIEPSFITGYNGLTVNNTSWEVTGLQQNTTYYYRVRAVGVNSISSNSGAQTVKTGKENVWNGSVWTPGPAPTVVDIAIIQGDYNTLTNGTFTAGSMRVDSGIFTIASETNFTVQNELVIDNELNDDGEIEGAQFNIENNANLIQVNDVDNSGLISVTKNSAAVFRLDYAMWSSPVSGQTLKGFSPNTLDNRFYIYNPVSNAYNPIAATTQFVEGRGYLIRLDNTHAAYDATTNYQGTSWTGTYVGTPHNGTRTLPLTAGYNSVGNPYPSPINIAAFYAANSGNLGGDAALYFWRKKNGGDNSSYASLTLEGYNANGQVNPDHPEINYGDAGMDQFSNASQSNTWVLNPGQGFIVQSNGNGIVFNNQMRVPVNNGQIFSVPGEAPAASRLWLNLADATGTYSQTMLSYSANGTLGIDYGRDGKAFTDGSSAFYSIVGDTNLGIQARPVFDASDVVPMGYKATAGTYTVSLHRMEGVFAQDQDIFLKDNLLGTTHNLKTSAYQFTTEAGTFDGRFDVIYAQPLGNETPVFDANNVIAYKNGNAISISTGNVTMTGVTVYDTRGRVLYNASGINATETSVNGLQAQQQVLIVKIATEKGEVSKKIIF